MLLLAGLLLKPVSASANNPGGVIATSANVGLVNNGNGTVTLTNGIVSILCTTAGASINQINYTYNNGGGTVTKQLLSGGYDNGMLYWESGGFGTSSFAYSVVANTTNYAEISLISTSATNGALEIHFSLLRGSPGFYVTPIWYHRANDGAIGLGETRDNIYAGSPFNWMCVDSTRNRLMEVSGGSAIGVINAPVEVSLWTNGIYAGQYEDKYKYSADYGDQHVWGWGSVGTGGLNVGIWNVLASTEYYNGGPMKRELMEHIGTTILNMDNGGHYGFGSQDAGWADGEVWTKVYGPFFIYCNNVTNTLTNTNAAAQALYGDAVAQAAAEQTAWPYSWFSNTNYALAANRGTVTGQLSISDNGNPKASSAGLWVGLIQQPATVNAIYDFEQWMKPYQFWVKTGTNGTFSIPNVIAGTNYTLYAFGPGSPGTFQSQNQTGGNPPNTFDLPASPFGVTVTGGATNALGSVTWTPARVGATVFEIGYPDRKGDKFRHGDDYWVGDIGPGNSAPSPIWSKHLEYPFDFPNGVNYTVGQSRWSTDWNYVQPVVLDGAGNFNPSTSTINFTLPAAPTNGASGSVYISLSSDYQGPIEIAVNGTQIAGSTGYFPNYSGSGNGSDVTIRQGINGVFSDTRINFAGSLLVAGANNITVSMRKGGYFANHAMYDYLRLELTGYVPPAPASIIAYPGNACNLVCWPVTPGATSYNILRSTSPAGTYTGITNGVIGPVCGSGTNNATWLDTTAANGTAYFYEVKSVNSTGTSTNSPASAAATPSSGLATSAPAAPVGLSVTSATHQSVTLRWTAVSGANFYNIARSTVVNNGVGTYVPLGTNFLSNTNTAATFTDTSPTDGSIYTYTVTATSAAGTSPASASVMAIPQPVPPASAPISLTGSFNGTTNATLNWMPVSGAVGYVIYRSTSTNGPFAILMSITETNYTDYALNTNIIYYYKVIAVNSAAASGAATDAVNAQQDAPASLSAVGTNGQVTLTWPAITGATNYTLWRGTNAGAENVTVVSGYAGTTYTNTGLANGVTYYYVVTATGPGGTSGNSPEAAAAASAAASGVWTAAGGNWGTAANWMGGNIGYGTGNTANFASVPLTNAPVVTLDSSRTISTLIFGDAAGYNWTVTGPGTLTLGAGPAVNVVNQTATISTVVAGGSGLTKTGLGNLVLGNATDTFTNGLTVNAGSVILDFTQSNSPAASLVPSVNLLTLAGGTLQLTGATNAASSQTFANVTLNAGNSVLAAAPAAGTNLPGVTLGFITPAAGGTVKFSGPVTIGAGNTVSSNALVTTANPGGTSAFVGGNGTAFYTANYATVGLYDFAATTGSSAPYTIVGGSQISGFYTAASGTAGTGGTLDVTGNITGWSGQPYLTGMRFNTSLGANLTVASYAVLTLADLLVTPNVGAYNVTFNNNGFRPGGGSSSYAGPYVIWQNNAAGELVLNTALSNSKTGSAAYVQAGPGTVWINATGSGYTGPSYLNGGYTLINGNGSLGPAATAAALNLNGGTAVANGTFALDNAGATPRPVTLLGNGGGLAATAGNTLTVDGVIGSGTQAGPLIIGIPATGTNAAGLLPGTGPGTANTTAVLATGTVIVTNANYYTGGTVIDSGTLVINGIYALGGGNYGGLTFNGGTLQYQTNFAGNGSGDLTSIGTAGLTFLSGTGTIDVNGNTITYGGSIGNYGPGSLIIKSTVPNGSLTLQGANTYSGATTVTNLTLAVNNVTGSATGQGNVTVQTNGVLTGTGIIAGAVTLNNGAQLIPGVPLGTLTLGNNLTLSAGSKTLLRVQHSPLTNSAVSLAGTLTAGGTLTITNTGGSALAAGDSFTLLPAGGYAGNFSSITLPALAAGLSWNTNLLLTAGVISVSPPPPPVIAGLTISGGQLILSGTAGVTNGTCYVMTTTNLATPLTNWTRLATNQFDSNGNFNFTNALSGGLSQSFYLLQEP